MLLSRSTFNTTTSSHHHQTVVEAENRVHITDQLTMATLHFIVHRSDEAVTCCCGDFICDQHECLIEQPAKKILFSICSEDCIHCKEIDAGKRYEDQWKFDDDGYAYCTACGDPCGKGYTIPKDCQCYWYVDGDGTARCNECDIEADVEHERNCPQCAYGE